MKYAPRFEQFLFLKNVVCYILSQTFKQVGILRHVVADQINCFRTVQPLTVFFPSVTRHLEKFRQMKKKGRNNPNLFVCDIFLPLRSSY